jgi:hypothetical protein
MTQVTKQKAPLSARLGAVAGLLIAVAPAMYLLHVTGVSRRVIIGFGVLCWAAGVLVKWIVYQQIIVKRLHGRWPAARLAAAQGALSSASELGAAAAFFYALPRLTLPEAVGLGAGAAFVEGILTATVNVSAGTPYGQHVAEQEEMTRGNPAVYWFLCVADRTVATVVQICSRTLVFLSVRSGNPLPGAVAFVTFAAIDGSAYYALVQKWPFGKLPVATKLYGMLAGFAAIQGFALLAAI